MKELLISDDIYTAANSFAFGDTDPHSHKKEKLAPAISKYRRYFILSDGCALGELAERAIRSAETTIKKEGGSIELIECLPDAPEDTACFFFADCTRPDQKDAFLRSAADCFRLLRNGKNVRAVFCALQPAVPPIPNGIQRLAEREYAYFTQRLCPDTKENLYQIEIERLCSSAVRKGLTELLLLRTPNVIGAGIMQTPSFPLEKRLTQMFCSGCAEICAEDEQDIYSWAYSTEVLYDMFHLLSAGDGGNVYNCRCVDASPAELFFAVRKAYRRQLRLSCGLEPVADVRYHCLDALKYSCTKPRRHMPLDDAAERIAAYLSDREPDENHMIAVYGGRQEQIADLEMQMLSEVDRICEKYHIPYFLAGGTMLGAVRNGRRIPWDDDIDVAFLREDFDRFRAACDRELDGKFIHSCGYNETESHYPVDKIRYKDTYYSTDYSARNKIPDGVFIDLLVHDYTSSDDRIADLHRQTAFLLQQLMEKLWADLRPEELHHRIMKVLYPLMRKVPMRVYHRLFERCLTAFRHSNNKNRVIDGAGKLLRRGMLPAEEMRTLRRIRFDDKINVPIPNDPVPYLTYVYGPDYMKEPPLSERRAPHGLVRIDLGRFVFGADAAKSFQKADLRGELFESEDEE